jgi:hypothetical protein
MKSRFALVIIVVTIITMFSNRFNRTIVITKHAQLRMVEREISDADLLDIVETGSTKFSDKNHLWVYKHCINRSDNLICAVLVLEHSVIIKTVMHHFTLME